MWNYPENLLSIWLFQFSIILLSNFALYHKSQYVKKREAYILLYVWRLRYCGFIEFLNNWCPDMNFNRSKVLWTDRKFFYWNGRFCSTLLCLLVIVLEDLASKLSMRYAKSQKWTFGQDLRRLGNQIQWWLLKVQTSTKIVSFRGVQRSYPPHGVSS